MTDTRTYSVPDISCDHCVASISGQLDKIGDVNSYNVDVTAKTVSVEGGEDAAIRSAIDEAGYDIA